MNPIIRCAVAALWPMLAAAAVAIAILSQEGRPLLDPALPAAGMAPMVPAVAPPAFVRRAETARAA